MYLSFFRSYFPPASWPASWARPDAVLKCGHAERLERARVVAVLRELSDCGTLLELDLDLDRERRWMELSRNRIGALALAEAIVLKLILLPVLVH